MNLTQTEIHTRLVLANCCLADLVTDYLEAERMGDESRMKCKMKDGFLLASTIDRLKCFRPAIPGGKIWKETTSGTLTPGPDASIEVDFMGYTILPVYGFPTTEKKEGVVDAINAYYSQDWTILRGWSTVINGVSIVYVEYDPNVITPSAAPLSITVVSGGTSSPNGDGAIVTDSPWSDRISNETAEKLFGILDSICDCPCGKSDSKITDDTLPKYTRVG